MVVRRRCRSPACPCGQARSISAGSCSRAIASRSASRWRIPRLRRGSCAAKWWRRSRRASRSPTTCSTARATTSSQRSARGTRDEGAAGRRPRRRRRLDGRAAAVDRTDRRARRDAGARSRRASCSCRAAATCCRAPAALDGALVTERDAWEFDEAMARDDLARQFGVRGLDGLGLERATPRRSAPPAHCFAT